MEAKEQKAIPEVTFSVDRGNRLMEGYPQIVHKSSEVQSEASLRNATSKDAIEAACRFCR